MKNFIKKGLISLSVIPFFMVGVASAVTTTSVTGYDEGIKGELDYNISNVEYKKNDASTWNQIDSQLIDGTSFNILGLSKGTYSVRINNDDTKVFSDIKVTKDDRSGYAHHNYTDGVGAYNDDGTLKDNAVVVYVTDSNKNDVEAKIGGKTYNGLTNILSNASASEPLDIRIIGSVKTTQWDSITYTKSAKSSELVAEQKASIGNSTSSKIYDYTILEAGWNSYSNDLEAGIETLEGLTSYISYSSGKYDTYWNMMNVQGKSNITIEGVGDDATIFQWGFTFSKCNSIEVKNLTFDDYTEDAIGIQGDESKISDYSNYWIHNCTFEEGVNHWDLSYEQDKGDGDGSTDFKFAHNLTISYCKYNGTHKTNLIGSGNTALQYNITLHHNYYLGCKARLPLVRQANIHMYNNYYSGTTSTGISARAYAFAFVENCYFDGKNPFMLAYEVKDGIDPVGTTIKAIGNEFSSSTTVSDSSSNGLGIKENGIFILTGSGSSKAYSSDKSATRTTKAGSASVCMPDGSTDYTNFDTNSTLFYYDSENGKSNVTRLDDASDLKTIIPTIAGAGVLSSKNPNEEEDEPENTISLTVGDNIGTYTSGDNTYYAYRAVGKITGVTEEEILNATITADVSAITPSSNVSNKTYDITTVYRTLKSNGVVITGCEAADNTWYFYFIIKGINSAYNGYSFTVTLNVELENETLTKELDTYTVNVSEQSLTNVLINFTDLENNDSITGTLQGDGYKIYGSSSNVKVETASVTIGSTTFTKDIYLPGSLKSGPINAIEITCDAAATIKVYCNFSEANRGVGIWNSSLTKVDSYTATAEEYVAVTLEVSEAGTYYIGSTKSGIRVYAIEIIYN